MSCDCSKPNYLNCCGYYCYASLNCATNCYGCSIPSLKNLSDCYSNGSNSNDWKSYANLNCDCSNAKMNYENCYYGSWSFDCSNCATTILNYWMMNDSKSYGLTNCDYCLNGWNLNGYSNCDSMILSLNSNYDCCSNDLSCYVMNCYDSTIRNCCCLSDCWSYANSIPNLSYSNDYYSNVKKNSDSMNYDWMIPSCWTKNGWTTNATNSNDCWSYAKNSNANLIAAFPKNYYLSGSMIGNLTNCYGSMTSGWSLNASCWILNCLSLNGCCSNGTKNYGNCLSDYY